MSGSADGVVIIRQMLDAVIVENVAAAASAEPKADVTSSCQVRRYNSRLFDG